MRLPLPMEPLSESGQGQPILLLHGLFGNLSNWKNVVDEFSSSYRIIIPRLPFYSSPITKERLDSLVDYLEDFIEMHSLEKIILMGNSMGGHVALLYAWRQPTKVEKLVLTGSSGLFENSFGGTFPHVKDYSYIRKKVGDTFFNKEVITKELVDEVFETLQSPAKTLNLIKLARAAQRHNVANILEQIVTPTLLVWGLQDNVTPPEVALDFHDLLPKSTVVFIDNCGHVPMMEQPDTFNKHIRKFLAR